MSWKHFTHGQILTSDDANTLMNQGRVIVANATERDTIAAVEGMICYRLDTKIVEQYSAANPGTGWLPVDTGWKTLPLASGIEAFSADRTPQYRVTNGICYLSGLVKATTGNLTNNLVLANLPAGSRPRRIAVYPAFAGAAVQVGITIQTGGGCLYTGSESVPFIYLDGINFGV